MFASVFKETMAEENWQKVQELGSGGSAVLFPIGVIEEHGPHLPLGADIYWSCGMCRLVKEKLKGLNMQSVIAPPYYWGINHCTGSFPGTFSLKPETMSRVLVETFENMRDFGFQHVYCFNYHGDARHVAAIVDAVKKANRTLGFSVRLAVDAMELPLYGWRGEEEFLLVVNPQYPLEWFEEEEPPEAGLLDIHAGAFETAVMHYMCPELVDLQTAQGLPSASLNEEGLREWLRGGEAAKNLVPLGYAGNPAGYGAVSRHVKKMLELQAVDIAMQIAKQKVTG